MIICIRRALPESHRYVDGRIRERDLNRRRRVVKETSIAKIVGGLAAKFQATNERVLNPAGGQTVGQISLIEEITARGRIVIGRKSSQCLACIDSARHEVLISTIVVAELSSIADVQPTNQIGR